MPAAVLDTGVLIDIEHLDLAAHDGPLLLTAITIGELALGANRGEAAQQEARAARLRYALHDYEILPYGVEEANLYGALASRAGRGAQPPPRRLDLQIAAAARVPLLTTNPADFLGVESLVEVIEVVGVVGDRRE